MRYAEGEAIGADGGPDPVLPFPFPVPEPERWRCLVNPGAGDGPFQTQQGGAGLAEVGIGEAAMLPAVPVRDPAELCNDLYTQRVIQITRQQNQAFAACDAAHDLRLQRAEIDKDACVALAVNHRFLNGLAYAGAGAIAAGTLGGKIGSGVCPGIGTAKGALTGIAAGGAAGIIGAIAEAETAKGRCLIEFERTVELSDLDHRVCRGEAIIASSRDIQDAYQEYVECHRRANRCP